MNAIPGQFGHSTFDLDRAMYGIVQRAIKREMVRSLVRDARSAQRRYEERGVYSDECWAYEVDARDKKADAMEAYHGRNEV